MTIWHTVNWLSHVMWIRQVKGGWPLPRIDETLLTCGTCFSCSVPCRATSSRDLLLKLVGILVFIEHRRHDIKLKIHTASQKEDLHDLVWKFQVISIKIIGMALTPIPEPQLCPSTAALNQIKPSQFWSLLWWSHSAQCFREGEECEEMAGSLWCFSTGETIS